MRQGGGVRVSRAAVLLALVAVVTISACVPFYGVYDLAGLTEHRSAVD